MNFQDWIVVFLVLACGFFHVTLGHMTEMDRAPRLGTERIRAAVAMVQAEKMVVVWRQ